MYDILQLNDLLVPELKDIADKLKIKGSDKLSKQDLIYKILDAQALMPEPPTKDASSAKKPRIIKEKTTANAESSLPEMPKQPAPRKKLIKRKEDEPAEGKSPSHPKAVAPKENPPSETPKTSITPETSTNSAIVTADLSKGNQNKISYTHCLKKNESHIFKINSRCEITLFYSDKSLCIRDIIKLYDLS